MRTTDIISFDLSHGVSVPLDVSRFFPLSDLHAIRSTKPLFDTIRAGKGRIPDLSLSRKLRITRFRTIAMLDLGRADLYDTDLIGRTLLDEKPRTRVLDLFPPLDIPYGALDTRGNPLIPERKYADIYRRSLPWSLHARRTARDMGRYVKKRKKPIFILLVSFSLLSVPALLYTKMLLENGYTSLQSLAHAHSREEIVRDIRSARSDFERANIIFAPLRWIPGDTLHLAKIALDGGLSLTRGLSTVADTLSTETGTTLSEIDEKPSLYRPDSQNFSLFKKLGIDYPTDWMRDHRSALTSLDSAMREAGRYYEEAEMIDHPKAPLVASVGNILTRLSSVLDFTLDHEREVLAILGADTPERYIVLNQNRDEIRANGGFPGSVITFTLYKGNIEDFRTDDVYYYDWNLYPYKEPPPPGLALISGNYGLRDVNYYKDFRQTLEKANSFIEKSGDSTVTMGIAIHQGLIEDMLGVLSGVTLSGVSVPFTSENFSPLMSTLVESRYGERTSAKDILGDFVSAFLEKTGEKRAYSDMFDIVMKAVSDGEILFASRNDTIENFLSTYRKPLPIGVNWAYPLLTSLSGNKSDRSISRLYQAETLRVEACTYENKLTFTHTHEFSKEDEKEIQSYMDLAGITDPSVREKMLFIQGKGKNSTYMRIMVPKNALLTASTAGIESFIEDGERVFAFTLSTPVGATTSKVIRYTIDVPGCDGSIPTLEWYRQPGLQHTKLQSR